MLIDVPGIAKTARKMEHNVYYAPRPAEQSMAGRGAFYFFAIFRFVPGTRYRMSCLRNTM